MYNIANFKNPREGLCFMNLQREREKRLRKTGRWFNDSFTRNNRDIYLTYLMPLILIISLCATVYVALSH